MPATRIRWPHFTQHRLEAETRRRLPLDADRNLAEACVDLLISQYTTYPARINPPTETMVRLTARIALDFAWLTEACQDTALEVCLQEQLHTTHPAWLDYLRAQLSDGLIAVGPVLAALDQIAAKWEWVAPAAFRLQAQIQPKEIPLGHGKAAPLRRQSREAIKWLAVGDQVLATVHGHPRIATIEAKHGYRVVIRYAITRSRTSTADMYASQVWKA